MSELQKFSPVDLKSIQNITVAARERDPQTHQRGTPAYEIAHEVKVFSSTTPSLLDAHIVAKDPQTNTVRSVPWK